MKLKEAEEQRKRAKTLARQQQISERIAVASSQLSARVSEVVSAAEQLRKSAQQIATGAEEA